MNEWILKELRKEFKRLLKKRKQCEAEKKEFYRNFPEKYQERVSPIPKTLAEAIRHYSLGEIIRWRIISFEEVCEELRGLIKSDELRKSEEKKLRSQRQRNQLVVHELR